MDQPTEGPGRRFPIWPLVLLMVPMGLLELAIMLADAGGGGSDRTRRGVLEVAAFWPGLLGDWSPHYPGQPALMFVTYGFIHGGPMHLLVNMVTLLSVGGAVLDRFGVGRFWLVYGVSLLGGGAGYWLLAGGLMPMVGASGALFGLVGAVLARELVSRAEHGLGLWPVFRAVGLLALLNVVLWWAMGGLLAWEAHLGGFIAGWGAAMLPTRRRRR